MDKTIKTSSAELESLISNPDVTSISIYLRKNLETIHYCISTYLQLWQKVDKPTKNANAKANWKTYRFIDTLEVCAQETERVVHCLQGIPAERLVGDEPLMLLEQIYGLWQPYDSDNSDDEDWTQETSQDEEEEEVRSESDIEIIE